MKKIYTLVNRSFFNYRSFNIGSRTGLLIIATLIFTVNTIAQNPAFTWAKDIGDVSATDIGTSIVTDVSGNVYSAGYFSGVTDFDPGPGTFTLNSNGGFWDVYVSKLDVNGNFVWAKSFGGTGNDVGYSINIDPSGNIFTTGFFTGSVDFDPGVGTFSISSTGLTDIFISKLDQNGNFVWAKHLGGTSDEGGNSIVTDGSGNVFSTGYFTDPVQQEKN